VGLTMCVINGASLFTSNIAYMAAAFIQRKSSAGQALWIVWLSYFTNLAGGYDDVSTARVSSTSYTFVSHAIVFFCCFR
jgi:formate/nitrite transporter FocA (FNT family)